jgi:hypothetical protein
MGTSRIVLPTVTVSFIEGLLALFAQDKEEFCEQISKLLKELRVQTFPGLEFDEERIDVGTLYEIPGLPQMWRLHEFYRALNIAINDRKRLLKDGITEAKQLVDSHFLKTFCGPKTKAMEKTEERYNAQLALAKKKLAEFESKTEDVVAINGLISDAFWSAVKSSFRGLKDHEHFFGICGEDDLRVCWFKQAA